MLIFLYRIKLHLTQRELGQLVGVSKKTVYKWETDQAIPTMANLRKLEKLFNISICAGYREIIEWDTPQQVAAQNEDKAYELRGLKAEVTFLRERMQQVTNLMADMEVQPV